MLIKVGPEEITTWNIVFHRRCAHAWIGRLVPGEFKHVSAFGFSGLNQVWVCIDVGLFVSRVFIVPAGIEGDKVIGDWIQDGELLQIRRRPGKPRFRLSRFLLFCVPAVRSLINLDSGALLPAALWRDCLKADARMIFNDQHTGAVARPGDPSSANPG
jgi:hypothetical protein